MEEACDRPIRVLCPMVLVISSVIDMYLDFPGGSDGKESACSAGDLDSIPGQEDTLGKGTVTHSSILACGIPWTEEPGGL